MSDQASVRSCMPIVHRLERDDYGRLVFIDEVGSAHVGVQPVQAFPIDAPGENVSLVSADGMELVGIPLLSGLDVETRWLVQEAIAERDFSPVIDQLVSVSTCATPSTWEVQTDRGLTRFVLKGEKDIRRLRKGGPLITDSHGVTYRVSDMRSLDRQSGKFLERFL